MKIVAVGCSANSPIRDRLVAVAARYNFVEIAEACRREAKYSQATVGRNQTLAQWIEFAIATVTARLLARPILQEYDAFHSGAGHESCRIWQASS